MTKRRSQRRSKRDYEKEMIQALTQKSVSIKEYHAMVRREIAVVEEKLLFIFRERRAIIRIVGYKADGNSRIQFRGTTTDADSALEYITAQIKDLQSQLRELKQKL